MAPSTTTLPPAAIPRPRSPRHLAAPVQGCVHGGRHCASPLCTHLAWLRSVEVAGKEGGR
jgi:hypothetical protein